MGDLDSAITRYIDTVIALGAKDIQEAAASRKWFLPRLRRKLKTAKTVPN